MASIYLSDDYPPYENENILVEIVESYPLRGQFRFEEHSPFEHDLLPFFRNPGFVGDESVKSCIGVAKLIDCYNPAYPVASRILDENGYFDFGSVDLKKPAIRVEVYQQDDIMMINGGSNGREACCINEGVIIEHPERFPFIWDMSDNTFKVTIQLNPLQENDPNAYPHQENPNYPFHLLIKNHNFCAASHILKEYHRARDGFEILNPQGTTHYPIAIHVDMGNALGQFNQFCPMYFVPTIFPDINLPHDYNLISYMSDSGDIPTQGSFETPRHWYVWDPFIIFHEMGHYFHEDPIYWTMPYEGFRYSYYKWIAISSDEIHSSDVVVEAAADWFSQIMPVIKSNPIWDYQGNQHERYLFLKAEYSSSNNPENLPQGELTYTDSLTVDLEQHSIDDVPQDVFHHPRYSDNISNTFRRVFGAILFLWDLVDENDDLPDGNWNLNWGVRPMDSFQVTPRFIWRFLSDYYEFEGYRGNDLYNVYCDINTYLGNYETFHKAFLNVARMYHMPYGPNTAYNDRYYYPDNFPTKTLQQALDSEEFMPGDTLIIRPGTYTANLVLNEFPVVGSEFLISGDPSVIETTVIKPETTGNMITISNTNARLVGLTLEGENPGYTGGIMIDNSRVLISDCRISDFDIAITGNDANDTTVRNCVFEDNEYGVHFGLNYRNEYEGGIIYRFENTIFNNNQTCVGVPSYPGVFGDIVNCVYANNDYIFGSMNTGNTIRSFKNTIFYNNQNYAFHPATDVTYCNIYRPGEGIYGDPEDCNINEAPLFVNPSSDFHIAWDENQKSPCIECRGSVHSGF